MNLIHYTKAQKIDIDYDTLLISSALFFYKLFDAINFSDKAKILFCSLCPTDIIATAFPLALRLGKCKKACVKKVLKSIFTRQYNSMKKLLKLIDKNNGLIFQDGINFETNNYCFELNLKEKKFLPIPVNPSEIIANTELINENALNIGWLGRLVDFKIYSLLKIMEDADEYSLKQNITVNMHIIGSGDKQDIAKNYPIKSKKLNLIFLNILVEEDLNKYLAENVDILFAMGTSCIEGAKLKLPSVLVDAGLSYFPDDYKYKWLYETLDYSLGEYVEDLQSQNNHSFKDLINQKKLEEGIRCYDYYMLNHTIENSAKLIIDYANRCTLDINMLKKAGLFNSSLYFLWEAKKFWHKYIAHSNYDM